MAAEQLFTAEGPPRRGCGGIFFMGAGCGCFLCLILCCGLLGVAGWMFAEMASDDPARVVQRRHNIADLEVPEEFTPKQSFDFTIPFVDRRLLSWVVYEGHAENGVLILAEFGEEMGTAKIDDMLAQLKTSLAEHDSLPADIEVAESEQQELVIRGQPAEFTLARGRSKESPEGAEYWLVTGAFPGRQGKAVLLMIVDTSVFTREQIMTLLESIR